MHMTSYDVLSILLPIMPISALRCNWSSPFMKPLLAMNSFIAQHMHGIWLACRYCWLSSQRMSAWACRLRSLHLRIDNIFYDDGVYHSDGPMICAQRSTASQTTLTSLKFSVSHTSYPGDEISIGTVITFHKPVRWLPQPSVLIVRLSLNLLVSITIRERHPKLLHKHVGLVHSDDGIYGMILLCTDQQCSIRHR